MPERAPRRGASLVSRTGADDATEGSFLPSGPGNGDTDGISSSPLVSTDGDIFDSFESAVPHWSAGDTVIAAGNVHWKVVSVIPAEFAAEFVDGALNGVLEVEPL